LDLRLRLETSKPLIRLHDPGTPLNISRHHHEGGSSPVSSRRRSLTELRPA